MRNNWYILSYGLHMKTHNDKKKLCELQFIIVIFKRRVPDLGEKVLEKNNSYFPSIQHGQHGKRLLQHLFAVAGKSLLCCYLATVWVNTSIDSPSIRIDHIENYVSRNPSTLAYNSRCGNVLTEPLPSTEKRGTPS